MFYTTFSLMYEGTFGTSIRKTYMATFDYTDMLLE